MKVKITCTVDLNDAAVKAIKRYKNRKCLPGYPVRNFINEFVLGLGVDKLADIIFAEEEKAPLCIKGAEIERLT